MILDVFVFAAQGWVTAGINSGGIIIPSIGASRWAVFAGVVEDVFIFVAKSRFAGGVCIGCIVARGIGGARRAAFAGVVEDVLILSAGDGNAGRPGDLKARIAKTGLGVLCANVV